MQHIDQAQACPARQHPAGTALSHVHGLPPTPGETRAAEPTKLAAKLPATRRAGIRLPLQKPDYRPVAASVKRGKPEFRKFRLVFGRAGDPPKVSAISKQHGLAHGLPFLRRLVFILKKNRKRTGKCPSPGIRLASAIPGSGHRTPARKSSGPSKPNRARTVTHRQWAAEWRHCHGPQALLWVDRA